MNYLDEVLEDSKDLNPNEISAERIINEILDPIIPFIIDERQYEVLKKSILNIFDDELK